MPPVTTAVLPSRRKGVGGDIANPEARASSDDTADETRHERDRATNAREIVVGAFGGFVSRVSRQIIQKISAASPRVTGARPKMADEELPRRPSLSAEIGPPLSPGRDGVAAAAAAGGGLFKALFGRPPSTSHSAVVNNTSFSDLSSFVGGEEEAHAVWRDKWEARDTFRVAPTVGMRDPPSARGANSASR